MELLPEPAIQGVAQRYKKARRELEAAPGLEALPDDAGALPRVQKRRLEQRQARARALGVPEQLLGQVARNWRARTEAYRDKLKPTERVGIERIFGRSDLIGAVFFARGARACRAVGRVVKATPGGAVKAEGTGFLVSPRLLITNHHVLPDEAQAAVCQVELDYEEDEAGRDRPIHAFRLRPDLVYLADAALDYALVAVEERNAAGRDTSPFGFIPLHQRDDLIADGEAVIIVQHPKGEKKQVVLRDNNVEYLDDTFLHYQADTDRGSSGSPVFNVDLQIVALHHSGVPEVKDGRILLRDGSFWDGSDATASEIRYVSNEGIRIHQVTSHLAARTPASSEGRRLHEAWARALGGEAPHNPAAEDPPLPSPPVESAPPRITVPLPTLTERGGKRVSRDQTRPHDDDAHVLKYHHFSVVMNSERRMAFYAACNTTRDPALMGKKSRSELNGGSKDKWILDPRIPAMHQIETRELYGPLIFDRGHLVRREDVYWGESERLAEYGNFDSFHYTNCTPQHPEYNQSSQDGLWGELENHIADEAELDGLRLCIFAGPVFGRRDRRMLGVRIPGEFWKVVFAVRAGGALGAWGFALSQKALVAGAPAAPGEERFTPGAFDTHQLSLAAIEARTDVRFDARLHQADVYAHEGPGVERLVPGLESIRLS